MKTYLIVPFLLLAAALSSCDGSDGSASIATPSPKPTPAPFISATEDAPVIIAASAPLSGAQQAVGQDLQLAAQMAIDDYGGALAGHAVTLAARDDTCADPQSAVAIARDLIASPALLGVVGPMCTIGAQAANPLYGRAGVVHIAPSATRGELSHQGDASFFRTAWHDDAQAALQARYLYTDLAAPTAAVVDDGEPYGVGLADSFEAAYTGAGGTVLDRQRVKRRTMDFTTLARQIAAAAPAAVVFEGQNPEGPLLLKALRDAGYTGAFMGPDAMLNVSDFITNAGSTGEGAVITGAPVADEAFNARFAEKAQHMPSTPFVLQAYDAVTAILRGAEATVADSADGTLQIDRNALIDAVRNGRFAGLSGSVTFDEYGDRRGETAPEIGMRVYRIEQGGLVIVE